MKETSPDQPYIDRIRFWASTKAHGGSRSSSRRPDPGLLPLSNPRTTSSSLSAQSSGLSQPPAPPRPESQAAVSFRALVGHDPHHPSYGVPLPLRGGGGGGSGPTRVGEERRAAESGSGPGTGFGPGGSIPVNSGAASGPASAASPEAPRQGPVVAAAGEDEKHPPQSLAKRFNEALKRIVLYSWLNVLLVFVPVGIIVELVPGMPPAIVFSMNAIAIIPLAGLLSFATESVAHKMGDSIGALLNVTFGNAVELIILYAAAFSPLPPPPFPQVLFAASIADR